MLIPRHFGVGYPAALFLCGTVAVWAAACGSGATQDVGAPDRDAESVLPELPESRSSQDDGANGPRGISLECRIIEAGTGRGLPGVRAVTSLIRYVESPSVSGRLMMEKTIIGDCVSAEGGHFTVALDLQTLASSRCLVTAWSKEWAGYQQLTINDLQDDGHIDQPLDVLANARTATIRLRTVNARGESVPGCAVLVLPAWGTWQRIRAWYAWPNLECEEFVGALGLLATSGPNGEITMLRVPICEEPDGGYFAFAFDEGHASLQEWIEQPEVVSAEFPPVEIPVEPIETLCLEGVVADASDKTIPGANISVNGVPVAVVGDDGRWRIEGSLLGAGPWTISFRASGYMELSFTLPRPEYLLLEDAKSVHLTMEKER